MAASIDCSLISIQGPLTRWKLWPVGIKELDLFSVKWSGEEQGRKEPESFPAFGGRKPKGTHPGQFVTDVSPLFPLDIAAVFQRSHAAPRENIRQISQFLLLLHAKLYLNYEHFNWINAFTLFQQEFLWWLVLVASCDCTFRNVLNISKKGVK